MNMTTLVDIVATRGPLSRNNHRPDDNKALQAALYAAGYRVGVDGAFGLRTEQVVRQFQQQHGLTVDGVAGSKTVAVLVRPHEQLVATATPLVKMTQFNVATPHDDTASLISYYGDPRNGLEAWKAANVVSVVCPWVLFYEGKRWNHPIQFHHKQAGNLKQAMDTIWAACGRTDDSALLTHVRNFSGSGEFRAVRGSSRLSTHAFWASLDFDAERLPLNHGVPKTEMPEEIVNAFIASGAFWGGNYTGRKDPMHFQYAHE
jgi:hypothetical protein